MQLINWEGAVFGPGSEWLWSFASFLVVVVSLIGIRRQLRLAAAANAITRSEALERHWGSPQLLATRLELLMHLRAGKVDTAGLGMAIDIITFFAVIQRLEAQGAMALDDVAGEWGYALLTWWEFIEPTLLATEPTASGSLGAFVERVRARIAEGGGPVPTATPELMDRQITWARHDLERDLALLRGELPPSLRA